MAQTTGKSRNNYIIDMGKCTRPLILASRTCPRGMVISLVDTTRKDRYTGYFIITSGVVSLGMYGCRTSTFDKVYAASCSQLFCISVTLT